MKIQDVNNMSSEDFIENFKNIFEKTFSIASFSEKKRPYKDKKHLIIPYTLDNNDMRFATNQGFNSGEQFFQYLKDSFDCLYKEGKFFPKMMSIGLHCRLIGRPGRNESLKRFLDYVKKFDDVWICKRDEIANHWYKNYQ